MLVKVSSDTRMMPPGKASFLPCLSRSLFGFLQHVLRDEPQCGIGQLDCSVETSPKSYGYLTARGSSRKPAPPCRGAGPRYMRLVSDSFLESVYPRGLAQQCADTRVSYCALVISHRSDQEIKVVSLGNSGLLWAEQSR